MKKAISAVVIMLLLTSMLLFSSSIRQVGAVGVFAAIQWERTYGGTSEDVAKCVVQTSDGGYAILGDTYSYGAGQADMWLVKTDASGNMQWNKTYGGTNDDFGSSLLQTADGGFILAGNTASFGLGIFDVWIVKTDSNGNTQWNKTFGTSDIDAIEGERSIVQTSDGGYAVAADTTSRVWLIKMDANGNTEWNKTYGSYWGSKSMVVTVDGGYAIAGFALHSNSMLDALLLKIDSNGNMQWSKSYGGPDVDSALSVVQTSDGGYALTGETSSYGAGAYDVWLVKTDANGNMQWAKTYGGPGIDAGYSLVQTPDGGFAIACWTGRFWLIKTDSLGNMQLNMTSGSAFSMVVTDDAGLTVAGEKNSDFWLAKMTIVTILADVNGDGAVNMGDIIITVSAFGSCQNAPNHPRWNPEADLNHDGKVDITDIMIVLMNFGHHYP